jgi:hypothetical protein
LRCDCTRTSRRRLRAPASKLRRERVLLLLGGLREVGCVRHCRGEVFPLSGSVSREHRSIQPFEPSRTSGKPGSGRQARNTVTVAFPTFCPKGFAGIGDALPNTLADRSIPIRLLRRAPNERVERFPQPTALAEAEDLHRGLAEAAETIEAAVPALEPVLLDDLNDRAQEVWEPLLSIAQIAGADWPQRAADAALARMGEKGEPDPGVRLLADIRTVFKLVKWSEGIRRIWCAGCGSYRKVPSSSKKRSTRAC